MLVPMARVELIGPRPVLDDVVELLHEVGLVHIEDLTARMENGRLPLRPLGLTNEDRSEQRVLAGQLAQVRGLIDTLGCGEIVPGERPAPGEAPVQMEAIEADIAAVGREVVPVTSRLAALEAELALLARYEPMLRRIGPLASRTVTTEGFDSIALLIDRRYRTLPAEIRAAVDDLTDGRCEVVSRVADEETVALVVIFPREHSAMVHRLLESENVIQARLPAEFGSMPFDIAYRQFLERREEMPTRIEEVQREIDLLRERWGPTLRSVRDALTDAVDEIEAHSAFASTAHTFVMTGWLPVGEVDRLKQLVEERFTGRVSVYRMAIAEDERAGVPVALHNPAFAAPYEELLERLGGGRPRYGTIDPTLAVAIAYPLIFGMIVGDVGYGAVMFLVVLLIRRRYRERPGVRLATSLLLPATISATLFGFLYGELFGDVLLTAGVLDPATGRGFIEVFGMTLPYIRSHDIMPMLYIALAFGVVQVTLGLAFGMSNAVRMGDRREAWVKGGLLGLVLGILILGGAALLAGREMAPLIRIAGAIVMVVSVIVVLRFGRVMGFVETIETVSGMASYIRIMAVGISGAIFADAVNVLVSRVGVVIGVFAALLMHSLHLMLSAFTPTIHALRLNFLEFFGRFYEPGKVEYRPFRKSGGDRS